MRQDARMQALGGGGVITGWGRRKNKTKQQQNKSIKDVKEHLPAPLMQKKKD